jgi:hypothetical protein
MILQLRARQFQGSQLVRALHKSMRRGGRGMD